MSPDKTQFNQGGLFFLDDVVHAIAFSPCGKLLAVKARIRLRRFSWSKFFQKATLGCATSVRCLAWSPSSHFLASGCEDMQVTVWDVPADIVVFQVNRLVFPCLIQFQRLLARHCLLRKRCRCAYPGWGSARLRHSFWWCCHQRRKHRDTDAPHDAEEVAGKMLPSR